MDEQLGIVGSGEIACGLAAAAARHGTVLLWARSEESAQRARADIERASGRLSGRVNAANVEISTDLEILVEATAIVEALPEDLDAKLEMWSRLGTVVSRGALLTSMTSSLPVEALATASGRPERFVAMHVFTPVPKVKLVELAFPEAASDATRRRAADLCLSMGKTPVAVPSEPGFVVNRLLLPYLFAAVRMLERSDMRAEDIDVCMTVGAGHPTGPLRLLDSIGLDVAQRVGRAIGEEVPALLDTLVAEGALGRKTGRGFHTY
jgi:3-hydroxybutyryl-CoA dehydrogenase